MPLKDPEKRKIYQANAYLKNREALLVYTSSYRAKHRDEINQLRRAVYGLSQKESSERRRKERAANPEKYRIKDREYYQRNREQKLFTKRIWARENKEKIRSAWIKSKYGISVEQYDDLFISQCGVCAICKRSAQGRQRWNRLVVDHDHANGAIRGLLCSHCNTVLGYMDDNPNLLLAAAKYILGTDSVDHYDNSYLLNVPERVGHGISA